MMVSRHPAPWPEAELLALSHFQSVCRYHQRQRRSFVFVEFHFRRRPASNCPIGENPHKLVNAFRITISFCTSVSEVHTFQWEDS